MQSQSLFDNKATIVAEEIRNRIHNGDFVRTEKLPSTAKLASCYAVSRETVNIAMAKLVSDGLIYRKRGFGTMIAANRSEQITKPHLGIYLPMLKDEKSSLSPKESPTWSLIFYGVLQACAKRGYTLIPVPDKGYSWEKIVKDYQLKGVLLPGSKVDLVEAFWQSGVQKQVKYCILDRIVNFKQANYIEEFSASEICHAVEQLIDKGNQQIAAICSDDDNSGCQSFIAGYKTAMRAKKLYSPSYVKRIFANTVAEYDQIVNELMAHPQPPQLILVFSYFAINGIIEALKRRGMKIPQDISVVMINFERKQYNNREISSFVGPGKHALGEIAANSLMDLLEKKIKTPLDLNIKLTFNQGETLKC